MSGSGKIPNKEISLFRNKKLHDIVEQICHMTRQTTG